MDAFVRVVIGVAHGVVNTEKVQVGSCLQTSEMHATMGTVILLSTELVRHVPCQLRDSGLHSFMKSIDVCKKSQLSSGTPVQTCSDDRGLCGFRFIHASCS